MKRGSHHSHHTKRWISLRVRKFWTPAEREKARDRTLRRQRPRAAVPSVAAK
jgi:hypothetical protein